MLFWRTLGPLALIGCALTQAVCGDQLGLGDWPQFRGHRATGVADGQCPPAEWDIESGVNLRWKTRIPGLGLGAPIVAGQRLFLITAVNDEEDPSLKIGLYGAIASVQDDSEHKWLLFCLDQQSGRILWQRQLHQGVPAIKRHTKASHANTTPATDGRSLVALLGSEGLHCYDIDGNLKWKKDLGVLDSGFYMLPGAQWGFGSSPIIYQGRVFIQCDVQQDSFVAAFDLETGDELWRTERDDVPSWGTPTIHEGDRTQLIVNGYRHSGGYDVLTGNELWRLSGGGDIPVPTPIITHDLIILSSAHGRDNPLRAIRVSASGEIKPNDKGEHEQLAWNNARDGVYMPTPIAYGDYVYACRINGVLSCYDAKSGERVYRERLGGDAFTASPVAADGKLYFTGEEGDVYVVRAGNEFELLATNSMNEICMATPAISGGMLFVRTKDHMVALGEPADRQFELAESKRESSAEVAEPANADPSGRIVCPVPDRGRSGHRARFLVDDSNTACLGPAWLPSLQNHWRGLDVRESLLLLLSAIGQAWALSMHDSPSLLSLIRPVSRCSRRRTCQVARARQADFG